MDYETAFTRAGTLGRAQLLIIVMVYVVYIYAGWQTIVPVFTAIEVPFYCADNETSMLLLRFFLKTEVLMIEGSVKRKDSHQKMK